ncbi:hypothetical protein PHYBOEH_006952 [Phytophthora boehmeriae]|uniref:Uncharacterized protein n=1 Tax=Phytophthora boehmeriae TaxID=109152 RepID=A0A8T1WGD0_9STRA|nr:hypothetical protein PHYBOEH_006952 [Phytophthora boehmeriae]
MESRRKRVEQKGRFTITEILPGSPYSPRLSPSFQDDELLLADAPATDAPTSNGSCNGAAAIQPATEQQTLAVNEVLEVPVSNEALELPTKTEEPPETHTQPPEAVTASTTAVEVDLALVAATEATAMDAASEVSTPKAASAPVAIDSPRKLLSPKKNRESALRTPKPSARRIKRKGRFTIIELASDSPTSVKNADDLYDHRFVTTTSIGSGSVESAPQLSNQKRSSDTELRGRLKAKPQRVARSMPRLRQPISQRKSRRRSVSPSRELPKSLDMLDLSGDQQNQQEAPTAACAILQVLPSTENVDVSNTAVLAASTAASSNATEAACTTTTDMVRPSTPPTHPDSNGTAVGSSQTPVTISAAQFLQQQQTIAALIRQQHDLKQIISVLQEQQQQLMSIPSQINELKRQRASSNNCDEETRELYMQVDTLTQSNETLQALLNSAEREARHRSLEIECLSEENDELRHRYEQLEARYIDERKQSYMLEEELQRIRMLTLTPPGQQLRQQQEHHQQLTTQIVGVE